MNIVIDLIEYFMGFMILLFGVVACIFFYTESNRNNS